MVLNGHNSPEADLGPADGCGDGESVGTPMRVNGGFTTESTRASLRGPAAGVGRRVARAFAASAIGRVRAETADTAGQLL